MNFDIITMLYSLPAVIIGLTVHEYFHAFAAFKLGDDTASSQGRLTLNPLRHIDPLGMLFIVVAGFGWAKPVQFNPAQLKNPRRDRVVIALAGPLSNLVMGFVMALILKFILLFADQNAIRSMIHLFNVLLYFIYINFGLFVFNILPIPPLDGSHLIFQGLKLSPQKEAQLVRFGMYGLFVIILAERRFNIDILPIGKAVQFLVNLIL